MTGWSRPSPHARRASSAAIPLLWLPMLFSLGCGASSEEPMPGIDSGTPPPPADAGSPQADAGSPALDAGEEPLDGGSAPPPPTVERASTYAVLESTEVYGQGLTHDDWGSETAEPMDLVLDVFEPRDAPAGRPAVVVIHGGGFRGGTRTQDVMRRFAEFFAERGWVTFSIDYRLLRDHGTIPDAWRDYVDANAPADRREQVYAMYPAARDAKAAIRWVYANAETYQIDTNYITALGGSAGSYLAIMLGVTDPEDFRDELSSTEDSTLASVALEQPSRIHTIIDHWGGGIHAQVLEGIDGRSRFDASDAPVSIVHGTEDLTVPFTEAEALRDAYLETGVAFDFHPLEGVGHSAWTAQIDGEPLTVSAWRFVVAQQGLVVAE